MNFLLLLILSFRISFTKCVNYELPQVPPHLRILDEKSEPINSSFPVTFYKDAYVDFRTSPPRLRIFTLAGCLLENQYLEVDVFSKGVRSPKVLKIFGDAHKANCRDSSGISATPCFYVANTFVANLTSSGELEKVWWHRKSKKIRS
ncbi:Protein CBG26681 [Caenorhabditis briggsae]|uniref:Protein CBG26681 n=1 Tax=Caenorhabditis briggsae TaxID=6238 RepID=H8WHA6_CAEBR|nr:Protein CBG26681 [Caenorhabditis briggsae]CCG58539.1 Protein CBG26681 [Caenorhabditis briggsae]